MFGEPPDADGACNARLFIADNYGDNSSTMRCQLAPGHAGLHKEEFARGEGDEANVVSITWSRDERVMCDHGCGRWDHEHRGDRDSGCPKESFEHEFSECVFCCPDLPPKTCAACGKTVYWEYGHAKYDCPRRPDAGQWTEEAFLGKAEAASVAAGNDAQDEFAEPPAMQPVVQPIDVSAAWSGTTKEEES